LLREFGQVGDAEFDEIHAGGRVHLAFDPGILFY
jgi:hypothetical protein